MKRHPSLAALARDHHHALVLAQQLKRDAPERLTASLPEEHQALVAFVQERFANELEPHFAVEELALLSACEGDGAELQAQAATVREHHAALRAAVAELEVGPGLRAQLDAFARLLEEHVRFEDRVWFPAIERALAAWWRMPKLPEDAEEYRRTDEFDADSTPNGLLKSHRLKPGAWGQIVVTKGEVLYVLEDEGDRGFILTPEHPGVVAPERPHHVAPQPESRFYVRFLRSPR